MRPSPAAPVSYSVDVNVLLYASDTSSSKHRKALRRWATLHGRVTLSSQGVTISTPCISDGWIEQRYENVPAVLVR